MAARLRFIAKIRLEDPRRTDGQKILVGDGLCHNPAAFDQRLRIVAGTKCVAMRLTCRGQTVAEISQPLTAQEHFTVREGAEDLAQVKLVGQVVFAGPGLV